MATESNDTSIMAAPPVDEPSYSDTNDFDLANLLYVQNIPDAPEEYQASLQANVKSTNSWLAWELTKVERAVAEKLQLKPDGTSPLPRDNSLVSKYKRTTYRTKVLDAWRKDAPWSVVVYTLRCLDLFTDLHILSQASNEWSVHPLYQHYCHWRQDQSRHSSCRPWIRGSSQKSAGLERRQSFGPRRLREAGFRTAPSRVHRRPFS